jgi:hypothetical protein
MCFLLFATSPELGPSALLLHSRVVPRLIWVTSLGWGQGKRFTYTVGNLGVSGTIELKKSQGRRVGGHALERKMVFEDDCGERDGVAEMGDRFATAAAVRVAVFAGTIGPGRVGQISLGSMVDIDTIWMTSEGSGRGTLWGPVRRLLRWIPGSSAEAVLLAEAAPATRTGEENE